MGGRATREAALPGLASWIRVRDYRINQLRKMSNVEMLRGSRVSAGETIDFGARRVVLATGARWRRDGVGRANATQVQGFDTASDRVLTPDDLMDGLMAPSPIVVFDDDHYYLGSVLAEKLRTSGNDVTLVTPAERVAAWTDFAHVRTIAGHENSSRRRLNLNILIVSQSI
jgi:dimethylamine/trimethylamine dehydrogenase